MQKNVVCGKEPTPLSPKSPRSVLQRSTYKSPTLHRYICPANGTGTRSYRSCLERRAVLLAASQAHCNMPAREAYRICQMIKADSARVADRKILVGHGSLCWQGPRPNSMRPGNAAALRVQICCSLGKVVGELAAIVRLVPDQVRSQTHALKVGEPVKRHLVRARRVSEIYVDRLSQRTPDMWPPE